MSNNIFMIDKMVDVIYLPENKLFVIAKKGEFTRDELDSDIIELIYKGHCSSCSSIVEKILVVSPIQLDEILDTHSYVSFIDFKPKDFL